VPAADVRADRPGTRRVYYVCPHNPDNPRHAAKTPDHIRAAFRDHVIYDAVDSILTPLLSHDRDAMLARHLPATQVDADQRAAEKAAQLRRRIDQAEAFMKGLVAQMGHLGDRQDPAARAQRDRIDEQFTARYDEHAAAKAELEELTASQSVADDPSLIDELPYAPGLLPGAPAELRARLYAAFQVHAFYRAQLNQATIRATITDQTPGIIQALLTDLRTDHDTANPERTNPAITAMRTIFFRDHGKGHAGKAGRRNRRLAPSAGREELAGLALPQHHDGDQADEPDQRVDRLDRADARPADGRDEHQCVDAE
jgi:hypothetical protein